MAQFKIDATRPFYAFVGMGDVAAEYARHAATDVQARFAKVDLEPKALRDRASTLVAERMEEFRGQARSVMASRVDELNKDARELPAKVGAYVNGAVSNLNDTVDVMADAYGDFASRGKTLVERIRRQQSTREAEAAAQTTVVKAKTARTQTTRAAKTAATEAKGAADAAKAAAENTKDAAKETGTTAKRNAKSTTTSAKRTASATKKAAEDAAKKVGD